MKEIDNFEWVVGSKPPPLQSHSAAKLNLLSHYLAEYFRAVVRDPRTDRLQISLVDGFCGGGAFQSPDGSQVPGTPMIMLGSISAAEGEINRSRIKKLHIDANFYFIDKSENAIAYLKNEINNSDQAHQLNEKIHLINGDFSQHYEQILSDISSRSRAGRTIFLLDQYGYKDVPLTICRKILDHLPRSEIILTFAIDWLIDYMSNNASFLKAVAPIELTESQIIKFLETKGIRQHRYLVQRLMIQHIQTVTRAPFFTPFFIRSAQAGRDLWLIHLSKHPTARNVMTSSHWALQNASLHQGKAGLRMLGFDPHWEDSLPFNFEFDHNAEMSMETALINEIPEKVESQDSHGPITFETFQTLIANDTAARLDQIAESLMFLHRENAIEIITPSGKLKRNDAKLKSTDRIQLSRQLIFPGFQIKTEN